MIYKVKNVIKRETTDDKFIRLCESGYKKERNICLSILMIGMLFLVALSFVEVQNPPKDNPITVMAYALILVIMFPWFLVLLRFFGNIQGPGIFFKYRQCKELKDYITLAEDNVYVSLGIILSKRLEIEKKEITEIMPESRELRCINTETGNVEILNLPQPFRELFTIKQDPSLNDGEIVLDLSGEELVAYTNKRNCQ